MLNINEVVNALDVAEALQGEVGLFEVTDVATGHKYTLATKPGHSLISFRPIGNGGLPQGFTIRKTANYGDPNWPGR